MIRLFYSNRTERLAGALIENLRPDGASLLDPIPIVVPSLAVAAHLKQQIAALTGIAANLDFVFLERFLAGVVKDSGGPEIATFERLLAVLLRALLDEELLARAELKPVREYLLAGGDEKPAIDLRRFQLAHRIARHFDEYVLTREQMLDAWKQRTVFDGTIHARTEAWERALWLWLRQRDCLVTLVDGFRAVKESAAPARLHLFDVQLAAPAYRAILAKLGEKSDLFLYALNPCLEFWEDMQGGFDFEQELPDDTPALRLWGRPGRESVRLLNALSDFDFEARFEEPDAATLLGRFQR